MTRKLQAILGRVEKVDFPDDDIYDVHAKVDTGAYRSSVWATNIYEKDDRLYFTLLGSESEYYVGKEHAVKSYEIVDVENSFAASQKRYSIFLRVKIGSRVVRTNFTLSDRSKKTYPVLLGRKLLKGRYLVDVSQGEPIEDEETSGR